MLWPVRAGIDGQPPLPYRRLTVPKILITPETAREYSRKAAEARRAKKAALASAAAPLPPEPPDYTARRLVRVRKQLARLDSMIEQETDPVRLDRLASAQSRLAIQEQNLAGRPLPGSLRPQPEPKRRQAPQDYGPVAPPSPPASVEPITPPDSTAPPASA